MAQINSIVGGIGENAAKVVECSNRAAGLGCDIIIFPELALTGYPPEDLLLKPRFVDDNLAAMEEVAAKVRGITAVVGFVDRVDDIYNAAALVHDGNIVDVYHKMYLPNYGVFDEQRYFQSGTEALNFKLRGVTFGIGICEDIWYPEGPARIQALAGAEVIVNINASPYHAGKVMTRVQMLSTRARDNEVIIAYNNMVGGQDELVFDGQSMIVDSAGEIITRGAAFAEELVVADINIDSVMVARLHDPKRREDKLKTEIEGLREVALAELKTGQPKKPLEALTVEPLDKRDEILGALKLGTSDYVRKNGFTHVVIGLSGGIDSALVAAVAAEALGSRYITGVFMPSEYSSAESREDAEALAANLGIELLTIPIKSTFESYRMTLAEAFAGRGEDITEENLQARIRGNILMALSNKFGHLVLTTGNKSEMSVGYATLYGDMAGGFAVIKDVPKMMVYELSERINELSGTDKIPRRIITKAPTAELKPDQTDQDTLPPYDVLDAILKAYVEEDRSFDDIVSMGFGREMVARVIRMVDLSEYKRRQAPPGVKITQRALGKDRRMPITNAYKVKK